MRTLTPARAADRDDGAVLIMVALMMTMLLGIGALVIDLGALYVEKRELQNGADAAALAIAQGCAGGNCGAPNAIAQQYVNLNARDAASGVAEVCGTPAPLTACSSAAPAGAAGATGWVKVSDFTQASGGGNQVQFVLAPIMNSITGATVRASAAAAWGPLGSATIAPLIFSVCEYLQMGGSVSPPTFPSGTNYIYFHGIGGSNEPGVGSCTGSPSGQDLPGGFGYLANTNCSATVSAGGWVGVEPGNSFPRACNAASWLNNEILIAVYDQERGTGNNGEYHVAGFVGFRVLGYKFGAGNSSPGFGRCPAGSGNSANCIYGEFTRFTTNAGVFGGSNFGSVAVKMVG